MPTGTPIPDIREHLLEAAERVLVRDGPDTLTSRAITAEAGVAKGMLHRHFADLDTLLATLVLKHLERLDALADELRALVETASPAVNVTRALAAALHPSAVELVNLVCSRHELLDRLRVTTPTGVPLLAETTKMVAAYLTAERGLGRVRPGTDVDAVALILVGGAYLLASGSGRAGTDHEELARLVRVAVEGDGHEQPELRRPAPAP